MVAGKTAAHDDTVHSHCSSVLVVHGSAGCSASRAASATCTTRLAAASNSTCRPPPGDWAADRRGAATTAATAAAAVAADQSSVERRGRRRARAGRRSRRSAPPPHRGDLCRVGARRPPRADATAGRPRDGIAVAGGRDGAAAGAVIGDGGDGGGGSTAAKIDTARQPAAGTRTRDQSVNVVPPLEAGATAQPPVVPVPSGF